MDETTQAPMQDLDIQALREAALNEPAKQMDLATPFWRNTDGNFAITDIPSDELMAFDAIRKSADNKATYLAAIICRALVKRSTGQRVFQDADRDMIARMGASVLTPIFKQISEFFGLGEDVKAAVENAKKNL